MKEQPCVLWKTSPTSSCATSGKHRGTSCETEEGKGCVLDITFLNWVTAAKWKNISNSATESQPNQVVLLLHSITTMITTVTMMTVMRMMNLLIQLTRRNS